MRIGTEKKKITNRGNEFAKVAVIHVNDYLLKHVK